ncbi:MAG: beta-ketoacyl-ACP synthase II [Candidatus Latescibacteria bacterium]|nr:beta-ketoacyl-ACP synthase II [Candidatus Latescibacterota bacterium]
METSTKQRVVITGMGVLAPNGLCIEEYWASLVAGRTGIGPLTKFDPTGHDAKIAGELKGFDPSRYIDRKAVRRMDSFTQYAVYTAVAAVENAHLDITLCDPERVGVICGTGIGGIETFEEQHTILLEKGPGRISPFFITKMIADMSAGMISIFLGAQGPNYTTVSACSSAAHAIGEAFRTIRRGEADVMITGGAEAAITPMSVGGFASMKALSLRNDEPERASRPFDADRDGFVVGEGAGMLVLEDLEHAVERGAKIYAELLGVGFTADAYHETAMAPDGAGGVRAIRLALQDAGLSPEDVDYINAHGTSTPLGDRTESAAIKTAFGEHAYRLAISSTKSMTGHLLGASGAIELVACIMAILHSTLPPTINYEMPDPECDLDYVPNRARSMDVRIALNNSFGFGGHNVVIVVGRYTP